MIDFELLNCRYPQDQNKLVQNMILRIRQRQLFKFSKILFIPENMTGFTHHQLAGAISHFVNVETIYQNGADKPGVTKTAWITKDYYLNMDHLLKNRLLFLDKNWMSVSATQKFKDSTDPRGELLRSFADQILRYGYDDNMKLTGKDPNNPLIQDDGTIAWLMFGYWPRVVTRPTLDNPYRHHTQGIL